MRRVLYGVSLVPFVFLLIGALLGLSVAGEEGVIVGALFGLLIGFVIRGIQRHGALERRMNEMASELDDLRAQFEQGRPEPSPSESASPTAAPDLGYAQSAEPNDSVMAAAAAPDHTSAVDALHRPESVPHNLDGTGGSDAEELPEAATPWVDDSSTSPKPEFGGGPESPNQDDAAELPPDFVIYPTEPSFVGKALNWLRGGNPIVRVGVVVLFFGIAFALKLAVDGGLVSIEVRLAGVAAFGMGLLILGWRKRESDASFALPVQGGGAGTMFLTVFAAYAFYDVLPAGMAFALLLAMVALTAALAVAQASPALAALGVTGGFLAPVLVSTGSGDHVALFSYYLLLNLLVLGVAWFNAWRSLNLIGFFFTFGVGTIWGASGYHPDLFASTEPFLVAFTVLYIAVSVLFAMRQPPKLRGIVDGTLVFGTPLVAFGLQTQLLDGNPESLAISALVAAGVYIGLAVFCIRGRVGGLVHLGEAFIANGVVFATLAVPLALDARWTAATWALEGAGVIWIGVRQNRMVPRMMGIALQLLAGLALASDLTGDLQLPAFANSEFLGAVVIVAGGLFAAIYLRIHTDRIHRLESWAATALAAWAFAWLFGAGLFDSSVRADDDYRFGVWLIYFCASVFVLHWLADRFDFEALRTPAYALVPVLFLTSMAMAVELDHPFASLGWLGWFVAIVVHIATLRRFEERSGRWLELIHGAPIVLVSALGAWTFAHFVGDAFTGGELWTKVGTGLIPAAVILSVIGGARKFVWPFDQWRAAYLLYGAGPVVAWLWVWLALVNTQPPGADWPIGYLPFINPIDIACGFAMIAGVVWWRAGDQELGDRWPISDRSILGLMLGVAIIGATVFVQANAIILRTIHFFADVPYTFSALFASDLVQSAFAVFWGATGLVGMALAARGGQRGVWFTAAALMGIVVVKLFAVDLENTGTMERVISFMTVGIALVAVGYFAPIPPKREDVESS
jgi:uncharacterized membrane protein